MRVCVCVCVCVRERGRERERVRVCVAIPVHVSAWLNLQLSPSACLSMPSCHCLQVQDYMHAAESMSWLNLNHPADKTTHLSFIGITPKKGLARLAGDSVKVVPQGLITTHPTKQLGTIPRFRPTFLFLLHCCSTSRGHCLVLCDLVWWLKR